MQPLPPKVQTLQDIPLPKTTKELKRFLGMLNYYQRLIPKAFSPTSAESLRIPENFDFNTSIIRLKEYSIIDATFQKLE